LGNGGAQDFLEEAGIPYPVVFKRKQPFRGSDRTNWHITLAGKQVYFLVFFVLQKIQEPKEHKNP
jgi:hypothetical protein